MIPVTQTKLHDPESGVRGNCLAAAIASVFELDLAEVPAFEDHVQPAYDCIYIANGMSPRGLYHSIVAQGGEMIHDPHPSRAGIERVKDAYLFLALDPARCRIRAAAAE